MFIKTIIAFLLLILFSLGPQVAPMKKDVMDDKLAEYKLAAFASEFQKVYPSLPDNVKGQIGLKGTEAAAYWLPEYGFSLDMTDYHEAKGFTCTLMSGSGVTDPFSGKTINGEYLVLKQVTDRGEKVKYVVFDKNTEFKEEY